MKKIILAVILLAAAGGITYYLLQKKKQAPLVTINKEFVTGKWKIDSLIAQKDSGQDGLVLLLYAMDSTAKNLVYDFKPDGKVVVESPGDAPAERDTSSFSWGKEGEFLWKESVSDAATDTMTVVRLDKEDFVLRSADSTLIYLRKVK